MIIMTRGLPGSGKSTWAKQFVQENDDWVRWNNDDFGEMVAGKRNVRINSGLLSKARVNFIKSALVAKFNVVLDNTNLNPYTTEEAHQAAYDAIGVGGVIENMFFPITVEEAVRRNAEREEPIPEWVIYKMNTQWIFSGHWPELVVE